MPARQFFVRNTDASELIELFLVASVAAVLVIRAFLVITGYPQLGGDGLHIAHMLWGGLFMAAALLVLFAVLGHVARRLAAILGGIGFGTFVDELGKFITSDNDYFYEPTIGLIYIIFIVIFLALHTLRRQTLSPSEALANVLDQLELAVGRPLDAARKREMLALLAQCDRSAPLVQSLTAFVESVRQQALSDMSFYFRIRDSALWLYSGVVLHRRFRPVLIGFFLFVVVVQLGLAALIALAGVVLGSAELAAQLQLGFLSVAQLTSATVSGVLILVGIWQLRRSRIAAYQWFLRGMLVSIFVTQVFTFLEDELVALWGVALNLLIYTALRVMIDADTTRSPIG